MSERSELIPCSILSTPMSRTLIQDSGNVYDGHYLATIFVLSCLWQPLCVIVRLNAVRSSIYTSAWAVVAGKGSFLLLVAESRLQNVAVSSLGLETTGIHRFLVRDLKSKKNSCHRYLLKLLRVGLCIFCAGFSVVQTPIWTAIF